MKRIAFAIASIAALIGASAFAADLPLKAPPPLPAPVYSWTGWYVGGNVGYGWGNASTDIAGSGTILRADVPELANPPFTFADSVRQRLQGVGGGGQFGYNYQINPRWVLGFETDIQASAQRESDTFSLPFSGTICRAVVIGIQGPSCFTTSPLNGVAATSNEAKFDWFGTVRGRVGYLLTDGLLLYGTGGLAYGRVGVSGNHNVSATAALSAGPVNPLAFVGTTSIFDQSRTNVGFVVGGGVEGRLTPLLSPNWTWKLEYLYLDLGSIDTSTSFTSAAPSGPLASFFTPLSGIMTTHTHFSDNIVRVGVNYQFH